MRKRQGSVLILGTACMFGVCAWALPTITHTQSTVAAGDAASAAAKPDATQQQEGRKAKPTRRDRHEAKALFGRGSKEFEQNNLAAAEKDFLRAAELDTTKTRYSLSANIARQFMVTMYLQQAEKAQEQGRAKESHAALEEATRLDPGNPNVEEYRSALSAAASAESAHMHHSDENTAAPIKLAPQAIRCSFHLRSDEPGLIRQVLGAYGIQATISASVKTQIVPFDTVDVDFAEATTLIELATDTILVPLDSRHVLAVADTKDNRAKYEHRVLDTIRFPGLSTDELNEMRNIARTMLSAGHDTVAERQNQVIIRGPKGEVEAMNQAYGGLLAGHSELQLDVHVYEVDKTQSTNAGATLPSSGTAFNAQSEINSVISGNSTLVNEIIASGLASAGDYTAILAILLASGDVTNSVFNSAFVLFGGGLTETGAAWNSTSANMLLTSSDLRSLRQVQLRVEDRQEATFLSGERYPIISSSYTALSGSSSSTSPTLTVPEVQYQNLGLTLKIKPFIGGQNDVTLHLNLQLDSLAGSTLNNLPVLKNMQYTSVVSLRPGESALMVSAMSKQDALVITGVPGLSDIPRFQDATDRQPTTDRTDLVILITPHIVRMAHRETAGPMVLLPLY
jgi:general secretion pathway protein D